MDFSADQIERTLVLFYKDAQVQSETNQYLMLAQMSPEAWSFPWQLLSPNKLPEVQFFGASTLHLKISRFWKELSPDQFQTLRMKLLETLMAYAAGPKIILTRLCVALSAFIIRTVSDSWPNAVSDVISTLQSHNLPNLDPKQTVTVLLELLTVLPEEFQTIHLPQSQRGIVRSLLQTSLHHVLSIVQDIVFKVPSSGGDRLTFDLSLMTLKCFASWSQLDAVVLEFEPLLDGVIALSHQPDLCQSALEALGHVVTHPDSHKYPNSVLKIINKLVISLKSIVDKALEDKDMDICCSTYGLAVSIGETHSTLLLETALDNNKPEHRNTVMKLIELILQCSGTPGQFPTDEICSEQTFGFWYIFQDDIVGSDADKFQSYLLMFHSVFLSLVDTYLVKVRYPPDEEYNQWQADEKESFRCYRQDIGDSFMYCYSVLRESMLASLMSHLQIASNTANSNPSQWQYLEACLYGFQSVSENIDLEDNNYLQQFFGIMPQLPLQHVRVISTTMDTIGAYAEWINVHSQVLSQVIPLLLLGLRNADMSQAATMALKDISRDCQASMKPYAESILEAGREALTGSQLRDRERVRLTSTIGQVLSIMPMDFIMPYLDSILTPLVRQFEALLTQPANGANKSTTMLYLNILSVLFATLDVKRKTGSEEGDKQTLMTTTPNSELITQPILLVLQQLMPVFVAVGTKWSFDEEVMEVLCEALKRGVATLLDDCRPLVPSISQLVSQFYLSQPHNTSSLDLAKQLLVLFGSDPSLQLGSLFSQITTHTMNLCQKDLQTHTVVAEAFFQLLAQLLKKIPSIFEHCANILPIVFQCAIAALGLPEKTTVKATSAFITELINRSRENPVMLDIVNSQGEALVGQVLKVIGGCGSSPRSVLEHMPEILMALNKKYFDNLCRWMSAYIQQEGFPSPKVTAQQKEEFTRNILKERTNKRKLKEVVTEFGLQCRGLFGTQFGAESFTSP